MSAYSGGGPSTAQASLAPSMWVGRDFLAHGVPVLVLRIGFAFGPGGTSKGSENHAGAKEGTLRHATEVVKAVCQSELD